ncbi:GLPGLI family protein [Chryseobacterium indoltheticum]|uniref:GLPGLI family protein n=1 Tax=Chryseobacterium indoltheticum TaxID=254 RepID=A0A381JRI4_9FLAO|nr:GLPGLI family protein [Chryseobacterium indoltheticum]AZA75404.1 GLPGLI family protein [Chryseobacterium indoltheticum]SIQ68612.1 GLPGLI family protein [Chryseobacterium indoltheticum]SUY53510.1 GLPGLI family protein [Chryseobacterium indoltheticum]
MFKTILVSFSIFLSVLSFSQTYEIQYESSYNGKVQPNQNSVLVWVNENENFILNTKIKEQKSDYPFEISKIEKPSNTIVSYAFLKPNEAISTSDKESIAKQEFELTAQTKKILGYNCKKAVTKINSNTIEVWYTNDLKIKGGPSSLGQNLGLVLQIERNGNSATTAVSLKKIKITGIDKIISKTIPTTDLLSYKDLLWKSRFTTLKVFENEIINFSDQSKSDEKVKRFANGTIILKKIKFPKIAKGDNIFVELKQQSNGDAYDRTGTVFFIPEEKSQTFFDGLEKGAKTLPVYENGNGKQYYGVVSNQNYQPAVELMRFFTSFGINKFNHIELKDKTWQTISPFRQDITELKPSLSEKELWIGTFIGNYDKGGHKVSLDITIHNSEQIVNKNNKVIPLFNTTNIMEMAGQDYATMFNNDKGLFVEFNLEKDLKNAQLRYITTGHGGWENGDEFIPKANSIYLDGKIAFSFTPWRTECGSYRLFNPASGNFADGLSSSDLSRSNWCPGTVTNPVFISLGDLKAGKHTIQVKIPQGEPEGTSFSAWNISGVLLGNE